MNNLQQLIDLWKGPREDDYGRLRPTQHAFDKSRCLLIESHLQYCIPTGCVSTDSAGGVRIEWIRPTVSVHLVIPATRDHVPYIYHQVGYVYATEDMTPERLAYWLLYFHERCTND